MEENINKISKEEENQILKEKIKVLTKKNNNNKFVKKFGLLNLISAGAIVFLVSNIVYTYNSSTISKSESEKVFNEKEQALEKQHNLKKDIVFYKKKEGIEKLARESLGLIKSDEIPVKYIESNKK
ncbi:MAG: septum formation initiator family protein [Candidatus Sericytochromatia bacterium]